MCIRDRHCALIGSNGSGKSTLVDMLINTDQYLYDGKIMKDESCRIGSVSYTHLMTCSSFPMK